MEGDLASSFITMEVSSDMGKCSHSGVVEMKVWLMHILERRIKSRWHGMYWHPHFRVGETEGQES